MAKKKTQQTARKKIISAPAPKAIPVVNKQEGFRIPYPMLWLGITAFALYVPTFSFKFTELDDSIFIRDFSAYNEDLHNLIVSFRRGVFDALKDPYYRPLFLDSMILNYQMSGQDIMGYHVVNVLFHVLNVLLLYLLLRKIAIKETIAFILALVFAVHPVLSQAVAWIPGRNDTLLAIFTLAFLIFSIEYSKKGKTYSLILSCLFLLLAYFTKETAAFAAPVAFVLILFVLQKKWNDQCNLIQYATWAGCFLLWLIVRAMETVQPDHLSLLKVFKDFVHRLPLIVQYIGKIFLPFNLSVFPIQEDTVNYYGIIAIALLAVLLFLNKNRNARMILSGLAVFFLFLLPVLFVPNNLNEQTFEHRLYLPIIGILLVLPQTILFNNKLSEQNLLIGGICVCALLALLNLRHQRNFDNPVSFWSSAVETSPHSAYANMMLGARVNDMGESSALFRKAYQLNPKEKYLNYYYGVMLQKQDSVQQSEKYLLAEKNTSDYYECDFYLARVYAERKDFNAAINSLESYLKRDPGNKMAHNNLLLLYLQTQQKDKAIAEVKHMQLMRLEVPKQLLQQLGR